MATQAKIRTLTADPIGLAVWLERESETMNPLQFFREAVQNELEAGATKITIDGFRSKAGHVLTRVSGNGCGMSNKKLVEYLSSVMKTDKGSHNYGVGARIAALPGNPGGVTFASKTKAGEGMVKLVKSGNVFGLQTWTVRERDADGDMVEVSEEVIRPSSTELAHIKDTGTAVILHGDGKSSTWDKTLAHKVHSYLAKRYYQFPGNARIAIEQPTTKKLNYVVPLGHSLANHSLADGEVPFTDIAGLSGVIFWWVMPSWTEINKMQIGADVPTSGAGIVVEDEIFDYGKTYFPDFGILYKSVQSRVVILVAVDGAMMDTSRTSVVYPSGKASFKRITPWKQLGAHFSEHMPAAIDDLMNQVMPSPSVFTDDAAKKLDPDWMKWIKPVMVLVPKKSAEPTIGDDGGDALPAGEIHHGEDPIDEPNPHPKLAAHRQNAGSIEGGVMKPKVVTPNVKFVEPEEMPEGHPHIFWAEVTNTVMISKEFPPYVREIKNWMGKTNHPKSLVQSAVERAYGIEYAAYIIDANGQRAAKLTPEELTTLKTDLALYGKALGCQALTETIAGYLKQVIKAA